MSNPASIPAPQSDPLDATRQSQLDGDRIVVESDPIDTSWESKPGGDANAEILQKLDLLVQEQRQREREWQRSSRKDFWDKLQAAGALLVGIVGILFTFVYQTSERKQRDMIQRNETAQRVQARTDDIRLQELELMTTLLPVLTSDDEQKKVLAIRALSELGSPRLAAILAALQPSPGTAAGLNNLRTASRLSAADRAAADTVLQSFPAPLRDVRGPISPPIRNSPSGASLGGCTAWLLPGGDRYCSSPCIEGLRCGRIVAAASDSARSEEDLLGLWQDAEGKYWVSGRCSVGQQCARLVFGES